MRWHAFSQKGALEGRGVVSGVGVMAIFQGEYSSLGNLDKAVPHPAKSKFSAGLVGMQVEGAGIRGSSANWLRAAYDGGRKTGGGWLPCKLQPRICTRLTARQKTGLRIPISALGTSDQRRSRCCSSIGDGIDVGG